MTAREIKKQPVQNSDESVSDGRILILYNDDVHTFDYVITALMEVCDHDYFQASQCATLTHYKGKCEIKRGGFSKLKDMKDALTEMELSVTID